MLTVGFGQGDSVWWRKDRLPGFPPWALLPLPSSGDDTHLLLAFPHLLSKAKLTLTRLVKYVFNMLVADPEF